MNIDYEKCNLVVIKLHNFFTNIGYLSTIEYPDNIEIVTQLLKKII